MLHGWWNFYVCHIWSNEVVFDVKMWWLFSRYMRSPWGKIKVRGWRFLKKGNEFLGRILLLKNIFGENWIKIFEVCYLLNVIELELNYFYWFIKFSGTELIFNFYTVLKMNFCALTYHTMWLWMLKECEETFTLNIKNIIFF